MSLPDFSTQGSLFSTAALGASLFPEDDRYRLFAKLVYPCLARVRPMLEKAYSPDTGRMAIEPVFLLGVCLLQYVDGIPDRQAVDWLRYHAGWNFALNRQLGDERFHPSTLSRFRERLEAHGWQRWDSRRSSTDWWRPVWSDATPVSGWIRRRCSA